MLTGNLLLFLADGAFAGPRSLKYLDLTQTGLTSVMFIPTQNLDNLEALILGSNYIQSLRFPPNFPTKNLKYLDFQMNLIQRISAKDTEMLKQVTNLSLTLKGNGVEHIEAGAFSSMFFYSLDFGSCMDVSSVLEGLQDAQTVALWLGTFEDTANNSLPISVPMLQGLCNISAKYLNLQYRSFSHFSADTFECLAKLQKLDLSHTSLSELPANLAGMNMLKELILNKNSFEHLCSIRASAFPDLTHLYLKGNSEAMDLGSGCLEMLSKLQHLDLSKSKIKSIGCCSKELHGLGNLQHLNLSYNRQLVFINVAFEESTNLKVLDLAFTHVITNTNASLGPFRNLHLLQILNLSSTQIGPSIQHILQGLESLIVLHLSRNDLSRAILNGTFFQQAYNVEEITLSSCELSVIQAKAFYALRKLKRVDLSHNRLIVFNSDAFSNLKNIYLNFANNGIHIIPRDMLTNLSGNSVINLSYNPLECTCSNIGLLTWYKQNIDKIEDSEDTICAEPKSLAGAKLVSVNLSCGHVAAQVILIAFVVITVIVVTFILIIYFLRVTILAHLSSWA